MPSANIKKIDERSFSKNDGLSRVFWVKVWQTILHTSGACGLGSPLERFVMSHSRRTRSLVPFLSPATEIATIPQCPTWRLWRHATSWLSHLLKAQNIPLGYWYPMLHKSKSIYPVVALISTDPSHGIPPILWESILMGKSAVFDLTTLLG